MGSTDAKNTTANASVNSSVRSWGTVRVCRQAAWLGIVLDESANEHGGTRISSAASKVSAWMIPTDENLMVARHTRRLLDTIRRVSR